MTRDYATRQRRRLPNYSRARARYSEYPSTSTFWMPGIWITIGLLLGIALSGALYWKFNLHPSKPAQSAVTKTQNKSKHGKATASVPEKKGTRFDYYTLVPSKTLDGSDLGSATVAAAVTSQKEGATAAVEPALTEGYIIQAGSFRQLTQAEELKAKLALSGFKASIQTVNIGERNTWYRVYIGPFAVKDSADASRQKLEQAQQLHSLVLKIRV